MTAPTRRDEALRLAASLASYASLGAQQAAILLRQWPDPAMPIDMVLHCPACGLQHIDAPDDPDSNAVRIERHRARNSILNPVADVWTNPPHRSHKCGSCGHIWRPADVATNGVAAVKTAGKSDSPIAGGAAVRVHAAPTPVQPADSAKHADAHLAALLRYTEEFYSVAMERGLPAGQTANMVAHVERAARALHKMVPSAPAAPEGRWCGECQQYATNRCVGDPGACVLTFIPVVPDCASCADRQLCVNTYPEDQLCMEGSRYKRSEIVRLWRTK